MKRIKAACIFQTLVFAQKEDCGFSVEMQLKYNREDIEKYKAQLARGNVRHRIVEETEQPDGSIVLKIRKQYNEHAEVGEYFDI